MHTKKVETMTSRQRVIHATNHRPVDRMPIDLGFHYSTGISAFAYWNLREYLGFSTGSIDIPDMSQFLARVDEDILKRFHCDCILLKPKWKNPVRWNPRGRYEFIMSGDVEMVKGSEGEWQMHKDGMQRIMPQGGFFFDGPGIRFEDRDEEAVFNDYVAEAERIYKETDYYTMYIGYHAYFKCADMDFQCKMITDPEEILEENRLIHEKQLKHCAKVIDKMGGYIQAIAINSDLGTQHNVMCNPDVYAELCAPFVKDFCDFVHRNSDCKVFIHSCGSIRKLLPILVDCGVDIFNPVQISAAQMDPAELKKEFGHRATFWGGGCDTQNVLGIATPEEVRKNVRKLTKIFKPGGGFVFNQVHNIMGNVPPENIVAMLDEAYEQSWYV